MPKESYDNKAKGRWRHQWRKFTKHIPKSPRDTKVVFLPGRQALELFEVYDQRGIPRSNIVGIERDNDVYNHLKSQRLGIELFHGTDTEFFEHADGKFDIVNLDYDGTFNHNVQKSIFLLAGKHLLANPSVLGVAVSGRRENEFVKSLYLGGAISEKSKDIFHAEGKGYEKLVREISDRLNIISEKKGFKETADLLNKTTYELKDIAITAMVRGACEHGKSLLELNPLSKKVPDLANYEKLLIAARPVNRTDMVKNAFFLDELRTGMLLEIMDFLRGIGISRNESAIAQLAKMTLRVWEESYIVADNKRYQYESSGGTPMLSDFLLLKQEPKTLERYRYLADHVFGRFNLKEFVYDATGLILDSKRTVRDINNMLLKDLWKFKPSAIPPRVSLGSSYKKELTGKDYYQLGVVEGKTDEEIRQLHRTTLRQMAAFKAHVTMGRYGPVPEKLADTQIATANVQMEQPKPREFSLSDIIPRKYSKRLPENSTLRIQYFIHDLLGAIPEKDTERILGNIEESKWYRNVENKKPSDMQIYSFFDDLTTCVRNGFVPTADDVSRIYRSVLSGQMDSKVGEFVTVQQIPEKEKLTWQIYRGLREQGKSDEEISKEFGATAHQLRAYRAWNTMKARSESIVSKNAYAETEPDILPKPPNRFIDSQGWVHTSQESWLGAQKGYMD